MQNCAKALRNINHRQEEKEECVNAKLEYFMKMLFFVCDWAASEQGLLL